MANSGLHVHVDMVGGIAGDMFLAAAVDAGLVEVEEVEAALRQVGLGPVEIVVEKVVRGAIAGTHISFRGWDPQMEADHRHLSTIRKMLAGSGLSEPVRRRAVEMFEVLGAAEAAVHGMELDDVHFHEVGAVDSILDFVAAAWIIENVGATWSFGVVPVGKGTIETAHGTIPVPAPATARVLKGFEVEARDVEAELVTPTGATILATIAKIPGPRRGRLEASGFGCGTRDVEGISNVVGINVFSAKRESLIGGGVTCEEVLQLITEIDDESPEVTAHVADLLMDAGALDVVCEAVTMKKGRIGRRLTVLCRSEDETALVKILFAETATLGIRRVPVERWVLRRSRQRVSTAFGEIWIKIAWWGDKILKASPEYESCAKVAAAAGVPLRDVYGAAQSAARRLADDGEE